MREIILTQNQAGRRFDRFLFSYLVNAPHSLVYKLLRTKRIKLNGRRAAGNELTAIGDKVAFYLSPETLQGFIAAEDAPLSGNWGPVDIIYEDEHILLVNKPAELLTHSDKAGGQDTLVDRLAYYLQTEGLPSAGGLFKPSVCNRLDRNTSGLVACGKNMAAVQALNAVFAARKVEKTYLAIVCGQLEGRGDLRGRLSKDEKTNRSYVSESGMAAHTEYECVKVGAGLSGSEKFSLLKLKLHTGRHHQIRAHLSDIGHPLAGDVKYGGVQLAGDPYQLMLHCLSLKFLKHESVPVYLAGKEWQAPVPDKFMEVMG